MSTTKTKASPRASTRSTATSRRSAPRVVRPKPFTVDHYRAYARLSILDNGEPFDPEDFQLELAEDLFAGTAQHWWILPEGNGKTTFLSHIALYYGDFTPTAMIPIGAASREQAGILYRQAEGFVLRTPGMRQSFKPQEGYKRIKCLRLGGLIQVFAADEATGDGVIPGGLALLDELHRQRGLRLLRTWEGKLDKRGAQLVGISTAGDPGGEFEDARDRIHREAIEVRSDPGHKRVVAPGLILHDFRVESRADAENMEIVAQANPLSSITPERLRKKRASPTMTPEHWLRFTCNIAARDSTSPITPEILDPLALDELPAGAEAFDGFAWLDLGWRIDTTAMGVLLWESTERRIAAGFKVLEPPVDEADVVAGLLRLQARFAGLRGVVMDPNAGGQQMAQLLEKGEHPLQTDDEKRVGYGLAPLNGSAAPPLEFVAHSQDNAVMAQAARRFDEAIRGSEERKASFRWVRDGDWEAFRRHCFNAARLNLGAAEKWRYDRPPDAKGDKRRKYPIDLLTGLLIGHNIAVEEIDSPPPPVLIEVFG